MAKIYIRAKKILSIFLLIFFFSCKEQHNPLSQIPTTPLEGAKHLKYFIWKKPADLQNFKIDAKEALPEIRLEVDVKDFFSDSTGIYVPGINYSPEKWKGWWPPGNYTNKEQKAIRATMLSSQKDTIFSDSVYAKVNGYGICGFPQKTLRLTWKKSIGPSKLKKVIFPKDTIGCYKRLLLRNGGNDFVGTFFRDALLQSIAPEHLPTQNCLTSTVTLNGEYWGIHNVREKIDRHYIKYHFDLKTSEYDFYENCGEIIHESENSYQQLLEVISDDQINSTEYFTKLDSIIDIPHWIDYFLFQCYIGNFDWPGANIKFFKPHNGKWKWLVFDLDLAFGYDFILHHNKGADFNSIDLATKEKGEKWPNPDCSTLISRQLLKNPIIKKMAADRFHFLQNTLFSPTKVIVKIDSFQRKFAPHMPKHIARWGYPVSIEEWKKNIEKLRTFARDRNQYLEKYLLTYLSK